MKNWLRLIWLVLMAETMQSAPTAVNNHTLLQFNSSNEKMTQRERRSPPTTSTPYNVHMLANANKYPVSIQGACNILFSEIKPETFVELRKHCSQRAVPGSLPEGLRYARLGCSSKRIYCWANFAKGKKPKPFEWRKDDDKTGAASFIEFTMGIRGTVGVRMTFDDPNYNCQKDIPGNEVILDVLFASAHNADFRPVDTIATLGWSGTPIPQGFLPTMIKTIADAVIISAKIDAECPVLFDLITKNDWGIRHHVIPFTPTPSKSVSRCIASDKAFDPYAFKISNPTPSKPNDCTTSSAFILDDKVPVTSEQCKRVSGTDPECPPSKRPSLDNSGTPSVAPGAAALLSPQTCPRDTKNSRIPASELSVLKEFDAIILEAKKKNKFPWTQGLNPEIKSYAQNHQPAQINIATLEKDNIGWWVERKINGHYKCQFCPPWKLHDNRLDRSSATVDPLTSEGGMLFPKAADNTKFFESHADSPDHKDMEDYMKFCSGTAKERPTTAMAIRDSYPPQERHFIVEGNLMKLAVDYILSGAAFQRWPEHCSNVREMDANIGRFGHTVSGLHDMLDSLDLDFKDVLFKSIKSGRPISVIHDSYQTVQGDHVLGVAFTVWIENRPVNRFYKFIPLGSDLKAAEMFQSFRLSLDFDGISSAVQDYTTAIASDGASVNKGEHNSFIKSFRDWAKKEVSLVWCYGHRINLIAKAVISGNQVPAMIKKVMEVTIDLYKLFSSRTIWRTKLKQQCIKDKVPYVSVKRMQTIRWSADKLLGFKSVWVCYPCLKTCLYEMATTGTDNRKKRKAQQVLDDLTSEEFPIGLGFTIDFFEIVNTVSLWSQKAEGTRVNMALLSSKFLSAAQKMRGENNYYVETVIGDSARNQLITQNEQIKHYEAKAVKTFKGVTLKSQASTSPAQRDELKLSSYKLAFIDNFISKIRQYFPDAEMKLYEFFDHRVFQQRRTNPALDNLYKEPFKTLAKSSNIPDSRVDTVFQDLGKLFDAIVAHPNFPTMKKNIPSDLWLEARSMEDLPWTTELKDLIDRILATPSGATYMEGIFGKTSGVMTNRKFSMNIGTAEKIVVISKAVPRKLKYWNVYPHVRNYIKRKNKIRAGDITSSRYKSLVKIDEQQKAKKPAQIEIEPEEVDDDGFGGNPLVDPDTQEEEENWEPVAQEEQAFRELNFAYRRDPVA